MSIGICDSKGVIYDFAGPYCIGVGKLAFGDPVKYLYLEKTKCVAQDWDTSVQDGNEIYSQRVHNLFCDNCHSHVAKCLNIMKYDHCDTYNMFTIGIWMFFYGHTIHFSGYVKVYLPFTIFIILMLWANGKL